VDDSASSIPAEDESRIDRCRGGDAEPSRWHQAWVALAERLATIRRLHAEEAARADDSLMLMFDGHDQARLVRRV
jgi:hypothetical protein